MCIQVSINYMGATMAAEKKRINVVITDDLHIRFKGLAVCSDLDMGEVLDILIATVYLRLGAAVEYVDTSNTMLDFLALVGGDCGLLTETDVEKWRGIARSGNGTGAETLKLLGQLKFMADNYLGVDKLSMYHNDWSPAELVKPAENNGS